MGNSARLGVLCLMGLAMALARLVEVEFRPPQAPTAIVDAAPAAAPGPATEVVPAPPPPAQQPAPPAAPAARVHVVKSGETLGSISRAVYGTSREWERIYEANRDQIPNPRSMRAGMKLRIPSKATGVAHRQ